MGFFLFEGDDVSFFPGGENFVFSAFVFVKGAVPDKDRWFLGKVKTSFHEKRVRHVGFEVHPKSWIQPLRYTSNRRGIFLQTAVTSRKISPPDHSCADVTRQTLFSNWQAQAPAAVSAYRSTGGSDAEVPRSLQYARCRNSVRDRQ